MRSGAAAENMALDFLLLQRHPRMGVPRFRHYGWHRPAFTFGYSQKIAFVRAQLPPGETFDLTRRATGGGLVDHRDDWTYALVIPRGHALEELRATHSYRVVHDCLAAGLRKQGVAAASKPAATEPASTPGLGICFQQAEPYDIVHGKTGGENRRCRAEAEQARPALPRLDLAARARRRCGLGDLSRRLHRGARRRAGTRGGAHAVAGVQRG